MRVKCATWSDGALAVLENHRVAENGTSALSILNFRVQPFEFLPGVVDFELPIDAALFRIGFV
jgi:hypothetical protein